MPGALELDASAPPSAQMQCLETSQSSLLCCSVSSVRAEQLYQTSTLPHDCHGNNKNRTMVRLTMTPSIVEGLRKLAEARDQIEFENAITTSENADRPNSNEDTEPSLEHPEIGKPISHHQILKLRSRLKEGGHPGFTMEVLLRGSKVYTPPPAPKPEPVSGLYFYRSIAS